MAKETMREKYERLREEVRGDRHRESIKEDIKKVTGGSGGDPRRGQK